MIAPNDTMAGQKKRRIKKPMTPVINSRAEAEEMMHSLAASVNAQRGIVAERDARLLELTNRYAAGLAVLHSAVEIKTEALRAWAQANPDEFPKGVKSIKFSAGVLGFRTGTPKLKLLSRRWTWETVLAAVQARLPAFIRNKPEVDKEAILNQRDELAEFLPEVGLKVDQEELFFVEPQLTEVATKQTTPAN